VQCHSAGSGGEDALLRRVAVRGGVAGRTLTEHVAAGHVELGLIVDRHDGALRLPEDCLASPDGKGQVEAAWFKDSEGNLLTIMQLD
jgi:hypothetical protein